jgi:hypothetical protein
MSTPSFRRSTPQVFSFGECRFIAGLVWQSLSKPAAFTEEATAIAKELRFDLMLIMRAQGGVAQAGFSSAAEGGEKGAASIAAVIASRLLRERAHLSHVTSSCIGVFELPDQRWFYLAIRDSAILPQGDFIGTKSEALEQLERDYGLGEWDAIFGDASFGEWGLDHFQVRTLADVLPRKKSGSLDIKRSAVLRTIDFDGPRNVYVRAGAIVSLALALAAGGYGYYKWDSARKAETAALEAARRAAEAAAAAAPAAQPKASPVAAPVHPWIAKPAPAAFASACVSEFKYISLGSWSLGELICTPSSVSYQWSADASASPADVLDMLPGAGLDFVAGKAAHSAPLALEPGGDDQLGEMRQQMVSLATFLRTAGFIFQFGAAQAPAHAIWREQGFTISLGMLGPGPIAAAIGRPGVRLDKILYQNGEWQVEGTIYAK